MSDYQMKPYRPVCEACGEENAQMATTIRKETLARGGGVPMVMMMPLRPLNICDECREALGGFVSDLVKHLRDSKEGRPDLSVMK